MKELTLFTGLAFYVGAALDTKLGVFVFLFWVLAFGLTWMGWSLFFSLLGFVSSASYKYMAVESGVLLTSTILPWVFGISFLIVMFGLVIKYAAQLGSRVDSSSMGGFWGDGGDGGC